MDDRRKFMRFDIPLKVEFKLSKQAAEHSLGVTKNFSRKGLSFESQNFAFEPKETLELRLQPHWKHTPVSVVGDIIWKRQVEAKCLVGIQLREMDKEAKSEILDYAYTIWLEKIRSQNKIDTVANWQRQTP